MTLGCILLGFSGFAQKSFQGRIHYKVTYLGIADSLEGIDYVLPSIAVLYTNGADWRFEQCVDQEEVTLLFKYGSDTLLETMNMAGKCVALKKPLTKEILELRLSKQKTKKKIDNVEAELWYLNDLKGNRLPVWLMHKANNPKGFISYNFKLIPLDFIIERGFIKAQYSAFKIVEEALDATYFELPTACQIITFQAFSSMLR